jgi:hypothetical protein
LFFALHDIFLRPLNEGAEMKTYFWRICFAVLIITIMAPGSLNAACQIVGTTLNGYIVVCDGTDTIGVISGNRNDTITVETGAEVSKTDLQSTDSTASANATTIDARRGNDQIVNTGNVRAHAGMTVNAEDFVATALGNEETNASVSGEATAVGISRAGKPKDSVTNNGTIDDRDLNR